MSPTRTRTLTPEPDRTVTISANDYLDARLDGWAIHEAAGEVFYGGRLVHVDTARMDILRVIESVYPGKYRTIAPLVSTGAEAMTIDSPAPGSSQPGGRS
jgi:hypothetical protein